MNTLLKKIHARFTLFLAVLLFWGWGGNVYAAEPAAAKTFTLVIDAGHGGRDAGALGKTGKEKNINLSVALALGRLFEQNCPEVKVVYTGQDVETYTQLPADHFFLQPCSCQNTEAVIDYIPAHPHWRLSLQTHKLIHIQ